MGDVSHCKQRVNHYSYPNSILHSTAVITKHEIGNLYGVTAVYVCSFYLFFVVSFTYCPKYKLAAALFSRPRQETLLNTGYDIDQ